MITHRQAELLRFIDAYVREHGGVAPTLDEMSAAIGITRGAMSGLVDRLVATGRLRRLKGHHRAFEVVEPLPPPKQGRAAYFVWHDELQCLIPLSAKSKAPSRGAATGPISVRTTLTKGEVQ